MSKEFESVVEDVIFEMEDHKDYILGFRQKCSYPYWCLAKTLSFFVSVNPGNFVILLCTSIGTVVSLSPPLNKTFLLPIVIAFGSHVLFVCLCYRNYMFGNPNHKFWKWIHKASEGTYFEDFLDLETELTDETVDWKQFENH